MSENNKSVTLTIRLIRSFPHKNWKPFVIREIDLESIRTEELTQLIYQKFSESTLPLPFKTFKDYDTLKIETHRFGHKTNDPLINTEDDDKLILKPGLTLVEQGVENETEISFFNLIQYSNYKLCKSASSSS